MANSTATQPETPSDEFPLVAQIPLSSFTLPNFPPAASRLRSLTLTSDINLNEYQDKHLAAGTFEPSTTIPSSITHLTLELFSLGFPALFLSTLAKRLPNLQSLTLFSCLIDGLNDASRKDAINLFKSVAPTLRELHVVDTYARAGFWKEIGGFLASTATSAASSDTDAGLKLLEVSYTYRGHYESDFLNRIAGEEWPALITPSLVGLSLNFSSPPEEAQENEASMQAEKAEDQEDLKAQDGILPFAADGRATMAVSKKFESLSSVAGAGFKVLNLSMFAMKAGEVGEIAYACAGGSKSEGLVGLTASILLEDNWFENLTRQFGDTGSGSTMESLEIVGVPVSGDSEVALEDAEKLLMKSKNGIEALAKAAPKLDRFEMSILKARRIGNVVWEKQNGDWTMHRNTTGDK